MVNFQIKKVRDPIATKSTNWQDTATKWLVTINGQRFDFYTGIGITREPTYDDVLYCLLSDASVADQTYTDFCNEFGYEQNKESQRIYQACLTNTKKIIATGINVAAERARLADY